MTLAVLDARQSPLVVVSTGENTAEAARQASRAISAADAAEAALEDVTDLAGPLAEAVGTRIDTTGPYPPERAPFQFNANNTVLLYTATNAVTLREVGVWSDAIGSGDLNLVIADGAVDEPDFVSANALADATLVGPNRWEVDVDLEAGQHVLLSSPSGGVNFMQSIVTGESFRWGSGTFTAGSIALNTAADRRLHAHVKVEAPGVQIARRDLTPELADQIDDTPPPIQWDMFLVIGQSNAVGSGGGVVATKELPAGICKQYYSGALTEKTADPIGNAANNSALPAFALRYWRLTGRGVIFVPAASGSTALVAAADAGSGNWSATGTLRAAAIALLDAAKAAADADDLAWQFAGCIWCQGEQDAVKIDDATITKANYAAELATLLAYLQTETDSGSTMPFVISVTGRPPSDTSGYQQIRAAQREFAAGRANVFIGFNAAVNFHDRNRMHDGQHYSALGYDEMGYSLATCAAFACAGRA